MATTNYGWTLPTVGGSTDTWGGIANTVFDDIDTQVFNNAALKLNLTGGTLTGALIGTTANFTTSVTSPSFIGALTGNASTATSAATLTTSRDFSMAGGVVTAPTVSFNGSGAVVLVGSIADAALSIAKTSGLQAALDAKLALAGGTMAGEITRSAKGVYPYHADSALSSAQITVSTSAPSGGSNGDIWFKY